MKSALFFTLWATFLFTLTPILINAEETPAPDNKSANDLKPVIDTPAEPPVYKANLENSIAIGPRIGNFIWQGQVYTTAANRNGIRGNFIFNGPTIPAIGFGTRFGISKLVRFAPSIDFIFDDYVYRSDLGRAFQTQSMTGSATGPVATVLGIMISAPFWFDFNITERLVFGIAPGLSIFPRIALLPIDNSTGIEAISAYLNGDLRWLYPQTGISIKYALDSTTSVGFELQLLYPIWHLISGDGMSIFDGMIMTGFFGLDFYL